MRIVRISGLVLMILFLAARVSYAQTVKKHHNKGLEYGAQGKFEEAGKEFKKALEADQFHIPANDGLELIKDALEKRVENEVAIQLFKGGIYQDKAMLDEAIIEYKKAIAVNSNYVMAYINLGRIYQDIGMLDEAIAEYKKAIVVNPNYAKVYNNLGTAYHDRGMLDEEIAEYHKAIAIDPGLLDVHYNLGLAYHDKGMLDEKIAEYKKTIAINPNFATAHYNLGLAYHDIGQYDLAVEHCDKATELGYKVHPIVLEALKPYRK